MFTILIVLPFGTKVAVPWRAGMVWRSSEDDMLVELYFAELNLDVDAKEATMMTMSRKELQGQTDEDALLTIREVYKGSREAV